MQDAKGNQMTEAISRTIHQAWNTAVVPDKWTLRQHSWRQFHKDWEYRFWTDPELRELIRLHYGWFLAIYDSYPEHQRADAARYFVLHHHGGLYVDLEFLCLRPVGPLLASQELVMGLAQPVPAALLQARLGGLTDTVCTGFLAARPRHPFWEHLFQQLVACHRLPDSLDATGSLFLTRALHGFPQRSQLTVLPAALLHSDTSQLSQASGLYAPEQRASVADTTFASHHLCGSRWRGGTSTDASTTASASGALPLWILHRGKRVLTASLHHENSKVLWSKVPAKVSCLMVTKKRVRLAMRAIACYRAQTYPRTQLIIIDDDPDPTLEQRVRALADPDIVHVRLPARNRSLGALRNLAVQHATGEYVTQWDDDDLSHPLRLELQMSALHAAAADACSLLRHQVFSPDKRRLADSVRRIWEGSLLCRKDLLPRYPARRKGEDSPAVEAVARTSRMALLDVPQLYTYIFHGGNVRSAQYFNQHWEMATEWYDGPAYEVKLRALCASLPTVLAEEVLAEAHPIPSASAGPIAGLDTRMPIPLTGGTFYRNGVLDHGSSAGFFSDSSTCLWQLATLFHEHGGTLPRTIVCRRAFNVYKDWTQVDRLDVYPLFFKPAMPDIHDLPPIGKPALNHHVMYDRDTIHKLLPFVRHYLMPSQEVLDVQSALMAEHGLDPSNTVGVWYRGTDKFTEIKGARWEDYFNQVRRILKRNRHLRVWLQTDQRQALAYFRAQLASEFDKKLDFVTELPTVAGTVGVHQQSADFFKDRGMTRVGYGQVMLAAVHLLSRCKYVVACTGNIGYWLSLYRGHLKRFYQDVHHFRQPDDPRAPFQLLEP